jgi:hypothetical protein
MDRHEPDRYEPYFCEETDGVHFQVLVDDDYVQAYVSRALLERRYLQGGGPAAGMAERCIEVVARHRAALDAAVERRARREGPDTVLLRFADLP